MELNLGDYVRTKSYGIKKINNFSSTLEEDFIDCDYDKNTRVLINKKDIVKSSPNIIDLIEVGDYVNGHEVLEKYHDELRLNTENDVLCFIKGKDIKAIVTKQQFEAMQYVVKED